MAVLRYRRYDRELGCDVSGVYAYRAECPCGWQGKRWPSIAGARAELRHHRREEHAR